MVNTQKIDGTYQTVMSYFGVSRWDESIYIPAGLATEGNKSTRFYDYGEYPLYSDRYKRHIVFATHESPNYRELINSGRALIQYLELVEVAEAIEQSVGYIAVNAWNAPAPNDRIIGAAA